MSKFHLVSFNEAMRAALAAGRKTQTRRLEKRWPEGLSPLSGTLETDSYSFCGWGMTAKYGPVGSVLVVREPWAVLSCWDDKRPAEIPPLQGWDKHEAKVFYDRPGGIGVGSEWEGLGKLRQERFMPYWAGRTLLRVEKIRFQPVGEISEEDAQAEGVKTSCPCAGGCDQHRRDFADLWDSIHGAGSFAASPMVWAYTFRVVDPESDEYKELRSEIWAAAVEKFAARKVV